jgi:hypothetical protein
MQSETREAAQAFNPWREACGFYPPDVVARQGDLTDGQKRVYERLVRWAGRNGTCWYGFETIAEALGKSGRQVKRDVFLLERYGLMRHVRRGRRLSNTYEFLWHPMFEGAQSDGTPASLHQASEVTSVVKVMGHPWSGEVTPTSPEFSKELCKENYEDKHTCASPDGNARVEVLSIDESRFEIAEPNALFPVEPKKPEKSTEGLTPQQGIWFTEWWGEYWLRKAKKATRRVFGKHVKTTGRFEQVLAATKAQTSEMLSREPSKRPYGATWLNGERWDDEIAPAVLTPAERKQQEIDRRWEV